MKCVDVIGRRENVIAKEGKVMDSEANGCHQSKENIFKSLSHVSDYTWVVKSVHLLEYIGPYTGPLRFVQSWL